MPVGPKWITPRRGFAPTVPSGPPPSAGTLVGGAYFSTLQMTAADLARDTAAGMTCVRLQFHAADFYGGTAPHGINGINDNIQGYINAGFAVILCAWEDNVAGLGSSDPVIPLNAGSPNYRQFCLDLVNRWPSLYAIEIGNEINYHYTAANYLTIISDVYGPLHAAQPQVLVLHSNPDKPTFSGSTGDFDYYATAGSINYCDAVGFHGYKQLGLWDPDTGPSRRIGFNASWLEGVGANSVHTLLNNWFSAYRAKYGALFPVDGSGKKFLCTEIGIRWPSNQGTDAKPGITATIGATSAQSPQAGTYVYFALGRNVGPGNPTGSHSSLFLSHRIVADGARQVNLSFPDSIDTAVDNFDIWRLPAGGNSDDIWDPSTVDGAPFNIGSGQKYGFVKNVPNAHKGSGAAGTTSVIDDQVNASNPPGGGYFGDLTLRGFAANDSPLDEVTTARQIPKIISEYQTVQANAVCLYIPRSSFYNPTRGVLDPNYEDWSHMVHQDGSKTGPWRAFERMLKPTPRTILTKSGTNFLINGTTINAGKTMAGLMSCVRTAQAIFDDENAVTQHYWNYPDTGTWDPERHTNELVDRMPAWAARGINCLAITMQGGQPWKGYPGLDGFGAGTQPWIVSAFNHDGTLRTAWMSRLQRIVEQADSVGMCVNVALFYQAQIGYLNSPNTNTAINVAIDAFVDWVIAHNYRNVLLEVANECDQGNFNATNIDEATVSTLIARAQNRAAAANFPLLVSVSFSSLVTPPNGVVGQSDFVLLHGALGNTTTQTTNLVNATKALSAYISNPKPIFFDEQNRDIAVMDAAIAAGAGWGFHYLYEGNEGHSADGHGDYLDALQSVPANWSVVGPSGLKTTYFDHALSVAGSG